MHSSAPDARVQLLLGWSGLVIKAGVIIMTKNLVMQALPDVHVSSKHSSTVSALWSSSLSEFLYVLFTHLIKQDPF